MSPCVPFCGFVSDNRGKVRLANALRPQLSFPCLEQRGSCADALAPDEELLELSGRRSNNGEADDCAVDVLGDHRVLESRWDSPLKTEQIAVGQDDGGHQIRVRCVIDFVPNGCYGVRVVRACPAAVEGGEEGEGGGQVEGGEGGEEGGQVEGGEGEEGGGAMGL